MRRNKFSDKYGYTTLRDKLQIDTIDTRLKNRIWNVLLQKFFSKIRTSVQGLYKIRVINNAYDHKIFIKLYDEVFAIKGEPSKSIKSLQDNIQERYVEFKWYEVYNFLEDIIYYHYDSNISKEIKIEINRILEEEMSAYRFVDDCIAPIIDEVEIKEIEDVFKSDYDSVKRHLSKALEHLSDRESPDYQNSIKESITAVEATAQIITGTKKDLGTCIKQMNLDIHKQFSKTLSGLYTWTCQSDGIRHAHENGDDLKTTFDEAKFMLVTCSAFINYMISKYKS